MARDGTARGHGPSGAKAGRPSKALKDKIENGNPGGRRLTVVELPKNQKEGIAEDPFDVEDLEMGDLPEPMDVTVEPGPSPRDYMDDEQNRANGEFYAKQIFNETMAWLDKTGCRELIEREVVDLYAVSAARWIQCERAISHHSLLGPHPTTKVPMASPFTSLSNQYSKTMMSCYYTIYQVVKENCVGDYKTGSPQDSVMEMLLSE